MSGKGGQRSQLRTGVPDAYPWTFRCEALDGRTRTARALRERRQLLVAHLGGAPSYPEGMLSERAIHLDALCAQHEARLAQGEDIDVTRYLQACQVLHAILGKLGISPRPKPVTPLREYIAQQYGADRAKEANVHTD